MPLILPAGQATALNPVPEGAAAVTTEGVEYGVGLGEQLAAAFKRDNWMASAWRLFTEEAPDVTDAELGYEEVWDLLTPEEKLNAPYLITARNAAELDFMRKKRAREEHWAEVINRGPLNSFVASFLASMADPTFLIPARTTSALGSALLIAGYAAAEQVIIQKEQVTPTLTDSLIAIGTGAAVGGVLGYALTGRLYTPKPEKVAALQKDMAAVLRSIQDDVDPPPVRTAGPKTADATAEAKLADVAEAVEATTRAADDAAKTMAQVTPEEIAARPITPPEGSAAGAAPIGFLDDPNLENAAFTPVSNKYMSGLANKLGKWGILGPGVSLAFSPFKSARKLVAELVDTGVIYEGNLHGMSMGPSLDSAIRAERAVISIKIQQAFSAAHAAHRAAGGKLKPQQFNSEVMRALQNKDMHPDEYVAKTAAWLRENVFNTIAKRAQKIGLFEQAQFDEAGEPFTKSYAPVRWLPDKVNAHITDFKARAESYLKRIVVRENEKRARLQEARSRQKEVLNNQTIARRVMKRLGAVSKDVKNKAYGRNNLLLAISRKEEAFRRLRNSTQQKIERLKKDLFSTKDDKAKAAAREQIAKLESQLRAAEENLAAKRLKADELLAKEGPALDPKDVATKRAIVDEMTKLEGLKVNYEDQIKALQDEIRANKALADEFDRKGMSPDSDTKQAYAKNLVVGNEGFIRELTEEIKKLDDQLDELTKKLQAAGGADPGTLASFRARLSQLDDEVLTRTEDVKKASVGVDEKLPVLDPAEIDEYVINQVDDFVAELNMREVDHAPQFRIKSPHLKSRVEIPLPRDLVKDYSDDDALSAALGYANSMLSDIITFERFGWLSPPTGADADNPFKAVLTEAQRMAARAKTPEQAAKIMADARSQVDMLSELFRRIRGTNAQAATPSYMGLMRAAEFLRNINFLRLMGSSVVSNLPDIARVGMAHGYARVAGFVVKDALNMFKRIRLSGKEATKLGVAVDVALNNRVLSLEGIGSGWKGRTWFEGFVAKRVTPFASKMFGLPYFSDFLRKVDFLLTTDDILRAAVDAADGKLIAPDKLRRIAQHGMTLNDLKELGRYKDLIRDVDGLMETSIDELRARNPALAEKLHLTIFNAGNDTILTPNAGDIPAWMDRNEVGRTLGQFRRFVFAAHGRIFMRLAQMAALNEYTALTAYVIASISLGMFATALRDIISRGSVDTERSKTGWIYAGIDRSGILGIMSELDAAVGMTIGRNLASAMTGDQLARYATRTAFDQVLGPSAGLIDQILNAIGSVANDPLSLRTANHIRRLAPFQNWFAINYVLNEMLKVEPTKHQNAQRISRAGLGGGP